MALPQSREQFKWNCLRRLGAPVLEVNVDNDQVEDRIDEALLWYWDYHFDGSDKQYYKWVVQPQNLPKNLSEVIVSDGGARYSNTDTVSIYPSADYIKFGTNINLNITTDANGVITSVPLGNLYTSGPYANTTIGFEVDPVYTINTSTGSGEIGRAHV